jgi:hypothetical protein
MSKYLYLSGGFSQDSPQGVPLHYTNVRITIIGITIKKNIIGTIGWNIELFVK